MNDKWDVVTLRAWIEESLKNRYNREFQDLVTAVGRFLGFKVEFGSYTGVHGKITYDGLWITDEGVHIVLEIKMGSWIAHDVNQLGEYLESLSKEKNLSIESVFGLYVVGDESNIRALADQVRGSKYSHFIRVISVDNLLKLAEMAEKAELKPSHVYSLLIPIDSVNVGELIKLIEVIIEAHRGELTQPKPGVEESILAEDFVKEPDVVRMEELKKMEDGAVLICSSRSENVKFLLKFNAWGFIRQPRKMPRYFALYVGRPRSQLEYIGEIDRIIDPKDPASPVSNPED